MDRATAERVARAVAPSWREPQGWVHRVVESVTFIDETTVRRARSFDLTVPDDAPMLSERTVLPLALLDRRVLAELDIADDSGRRLPLLTSGQNGSVSGELLVAAARSEGITQAATHELLRPLATREGGEFDEALSVLSQSEASPRLLASTWALATGFVVYVLTDAKPGTRTLIKMSYSEPVVRAPAEGLKRWAQLLGWEPFELAVVVRAAGEAASYHFEVHAPPGGVIHEAALAVGTEEQAALDHLPATQVAVAEEPGRLAHLHISGAPTEATGKVVARLVPARGGWISNATLSAWFTTAVLVAAVVLRGRLAAGGESAVALLLVVNALASAVASRPAPHDLTAALLRGPRYVALALGGTSYIAAVGFVIGLEGAALAVTLIVCATLSTVSAVALQRAWLASH